MRSLEQAVFHQCGVGRGQMDNLSVVIDFLSSVSGCFDLAIRLFGVMVSLAVVFGCFTGVAQAAWRFGLALFGKKIQVIAGEADYQDIYEDLTDSGLIKGRNIQRISDKHQAKTRDALFLIVVYKYLKSNDFEAVIRGKSPRCGLIVYCPPEKGRLEPGEIELLNQVAFTVLCNSRGRLVNDVLLMMLSTSFKRSDLKRSVDQ